MALAIALREGKGREVRASWSRIRRTEARDEMHALRQVRSYKQGEGLSFQFQEEDMLNNSVSVTGFHCGHCQFLMLTMDADAVPAVALEPVKE